MPNNGRITICPYYRNESGLTISCEDVIRRFRWPGQKKRHMDTYCDDAWQMCPFAAELNRLYEEGDENDMTEHKIAELNKELKSRTAKLNRAVKREEAKDKVIKDLRRKAKAWEDRYQELKAKSIRQEKTERKAFDQIQSITQMYEARFAYLMSELNGGMLDEREVENWSKGKSFAIVAEEKDGNGCVVKWKVVVKDENESRRSESADAETGDRKNGSPGGEEKNEG